MRVPRQWVLERRSKGNLRGGGYHTEWCCPLEVERMCRHWHVSMCALDFSTNRFGTTRQPHRHFKALVYYCVENRMYLATVDYAQSLIKKARPIESICIPSH